jgi:hypothetical protein
MNNSTNISKITALPIFPDPNFITIKKTVVLLTSIIEKDKINISITKVE